MKLIKNYWILCLLLALTSSCSNEFDLIDEWKDIPIVYGLISPQDSINYIRVEKAFLDPSTSALEIAQRPDSLYYDNATVEIERVKTGDVYTLKRVDGNEVGLPREAGIFADAPNYLYQLILPGSEKLVGGESYTLHINRGDNKPDVTAQTTMLSEMRIQKPNEVKPFDWLYGDNKIDFDIRWSYGAEAAIFDVKIIVNYDESDPDNPQQFNAKTLEWLVEKSIEKGQSSQLTLDIPGGSFYQYLGNNIPVRQNAIRIFKSWDLLIIGGGEEILEYITVGQAATNSITSSQVIPSYTNLSEGKGIFSSVNEVKLSGFTLKSQSRDTLRDGIYTRQLNFQ